MITRFREHKNYSRNFKISLILSELVIIGVFLFSPNIIKEQIIEINEPIILYSDTPVTLQQINYVFNKPKTPPILFSDEIIEPELLSDVVLIPGEKTTIHPGDEKFVSENKNTRFSQSPRQLLEVLPEKGNENYFGTIHLKLKIGGNGKVAEHIVLFNSLKCNDCLNAIISAVYKSVWEPGAANSLQTEYWVEKSYTFN